MPKLNLTPIIRKLLLSIKNLSPIAIEKFVCGDHKTITTDWLHIKVIEGKPVVTGIPSNVEITDTANITRHPLRVPVRFAKYFRLLSGCTETEALHVWERLSGVAMNGTAIISVMTGEDIRWGYMGTNAAAATTSSNIHSCMSHQFMNNGLDLYAYNPESVGLAVLKNDGKVRARALVLNAYPSLEDMRNRQNVKKLLARIYAVSSADSSLLKEWANKGNTDYTLSGSSAYDNTGNTFRSFWYIPISVWRMPRYPYMDHFPSLVFKEGENEAIWTSDGTLAKVLKWKTLNMDRTTYIMDGIEPLDPKRPGKVFIFQTGGSGYGAWQNAAGWIWDKKSCTYQKESDFRVCAICELKTVQGEMVYPYMHLNVKSYACRTHKLVQVGNVWCHEKDTLRCVRCSRHELKDSGNKLCSYCRRYYTFCKTEKCTTKYIVIGEDRSIDGVKGYCHACVATSKALYCKSCRTWETKECPKKPQPLPMVVAETEIPIGDNRIRINL